jgi:hypothetical protein
MTVTVEYIPITPIEYPDEDGKPMLKVISSAAI